MYATQQRLAPATRLRHVGAAEKRFERRCATASRTRSPLVLQYPVVIINWVQYLGPPVPFSFPDSRDLPEVLGGLSWQRETPMEYY